jgi:hypothetical protein
MTWQEIIGIMRVEPAAREWAQRATWPGWLGIWIVSAVLLLIGLLRFWHMARRQGGIAQLWADVPYIRAGVIAWTISFAAEVALVWIWNYTRSPDNLLHDLINAADPWQLSPDGVTTLLNWLKSLGAMEIALACTAFLWLLVVAVSRLPGDKSGPSPKPEPSQAASTSPLPAVPEPKVDLVKESPLGGPGPEPGESSPSGVRGTPESLSPTPFSLVEEVPPSPPTVSIPETEIATKTTPAEPGQETSDKLPSGPAGLPEQPPVEEKPPGESGPQPVGPPQPQQVCFVLRVKYTNPDWLFLYLDGRPWKVGEERHIKTRRLYIDPTGRYINTQRKRKRVRLWYVPEERCLRGYVAPDWDGHSDLRFGLEQRDVQSVYEGETFYVGETRFQLLSCPSEKQEETNDER